MATTDVPRLVELDSRRRAGFAKIGRPEHRLYLAREEPDGTIVMTPAVVMSEMEARFLANPTIVDRVAAIEADPSRAVPVRSRARGAAAKAAPRRKTAGG